MPIIKKLIIDNRTQITSHFDGCVKTMPIIKKLIIDETAQIPTHFDNASNLFILDGIIIYSND